MRKRSFRNVAIAAALSALPSGCASSAPKTPLAANQPPSMTEKMGAALKSGTDRAFAFVTPKPTPADDPIITSKVPKSAKSDMQVALAQMAERQGHFEQAQRNFEEALKLDPNHLAARLGLAHIYDRKGDVKTAAKHYKLAIEKHPDEAAGYNDFGLCHHNHGNAAEAIPLFEKAVELKPQKRLYRNNLAAALVDSGRAEEAFQQLSAVHASGAAHYNLGYLLAKKQDRQAALAHFEQAAAADPSLVAARDWIAQLSPPSAGAPLTARATQTSQTSGPVFAPAPYRRPVEPVTPQDGAQRLPAIEAAAPEPEVAPSPPQLPERSVRFPESYPAPPASAPDAPTPDDLRASNSTESEVQLLPPINADN